MEAAIAREVREETGYIIEPMSLVRIKSGFRLRVEATYLARVVGGKERLDRGEVVTARFFPREALPSKLLGSHRELLDLVGSQLSRIAI